MSVYKPFTPQDYAVVPFNAHKQYNFNSTTVDSNQIKTFSAKWSSGSIDTFTSGNIKYNQIDHLFYKNYLTDISNKFGDIHYLKHKRKLYKDISIISIPVGLYGHKIKPSSLSLVLDNNTNIIDDSYGNLLVKGTNIDDYITDPRSILLDIGPINGFKKYDLNIYDGYVGSSRYYQKGLNKVNPISSYNTPWDQHEYDDSYFLNNIHYKDVNFSEKILSTTNSESKYAGIDFNGTGSEVKLYHDQKFNFNPEDDFAIELWTNIENHNLSNEVHLIGKSTTKTIIPSPLEGTAGSYPLSYSGSSQIQDVNAGPQYPFEIYIKNIASTPNIYFRKSDGDNIISINTPITTGSLQHVVCKIENNIPQIYLNGNAFAIGGPSKLTKPTQNNANIYIGNKGGNSNYFSGSISQLKIYNRSLTDLQVSNHYQSSNGSPYIGNIFYSNGLIIISDQVAKKGIGNIVVGSSLIVGASGGGSNIINNIKFQGSHLIYENEYKCTIDEHEYNNTLNPTVRKHRSYQDENLANFATGSLFKPYITTVGLYNEYNELLVVGKLGQPIRTSNETDTTIVLRWDT